MMKCIECESTFTNLNNYGSDNDPLCFDCKGKKNEIEKLKPKHYCQNHTSTLAVKDCQNCQTYYCEYCWETNINNSDLCNECSKKNVEEEDVSQDISKEIELIVDIPKQIDSSLDGICCVRHPEVQAIIRCSHCSVGVCSTCDFSFPNDLHLCPECVQKPQSKLNPKIKRNTFYSFGTAIFSFFSFVVLSFASTLFPDLENMDTVVGFIMLIFTIGPAIIGTSLAFGVMRKNQKKPFSLKLAVFLNLGMIFLLMLLSFVGIFM